MGSYCLQIILALFRAALLHCPKHAELWLNSALYNSSCLKLQQQTTLPGATLFQVPWCFPLRLQPLAPFNEETGLPLYDESTVWCTYFGCLTHEGAKGHYGYLPGEMPSNGLYFLASC